MDINIYCESTFPRGEPTFLVFVDDYPQIYVFNEIKQPFSKLRHGMNLDPNVRLTTDMMLRICILNIAKSKKTTFTIL